MSKTIYRPKSKIDKDSITIHGCGKFHSEKLHLNKVEAVLLYIELHRFIVKDNNKKICKDMGAEKKLLTQWLK